MNVEWAGCIHALGHETGMGILERPVIGKADGVDTIEGKGGVMYLNADKLNSQLPHLNCSLDIN